MLDQLKMLLLAAGAAYLVFRIFSFLRSLVHGYRLWVFEREMVDDPAHPGSGGHMHTEDTENTCARDSRAFPTREFLDS